MTKNEDGSGMGIPAAAAIHTPRQRRRPRLVWPQKPYGSATRNRHADVERALIGVGAIRPRYPGAASE